MKLVILGATGPSGQCLVMQALEAGHEVTAIVRNQAKITTKHEKLKVVEADIFSESSLQPHFEGQDAVLSCLGIHAGWLQPITFYSQSIQPIITAMKGSKVNRFLTMTTWCTKSEGPFIVKWIAKPLFLKYYCLDMGRMEDYLEQESADIKYTVVKPPNLTGNTISGAEIKSVEGQWVPGGRASNITRGDVAKFMLECLDTDQWDNKLVSISN
ncbi:flavin reductase (NADPH)-like [Amphiura filiformis]|uniref:flavin reductase (NADPH)-like n=1 Tax=Amphiura filiformis TaxID=82378 RepID=UPI003B20BF09